MEDEEDGETSLSPKRGGERSSPLSREEEGMEEDDDDDDEIADDDDVDDDDDTLKRDHPKVKRIFSWVFWL